VRFNCQSPSGKKSNAPLARLAIIQERNPILAIFRTSSQGLNKRDSGACPFFICLSHNFGTSAAYCFTWCFLGNWIWLVFGLRQSHPFLGLKPNQILKTRVPKLLCPLVVEVSLFIYAMYTLSLRFPPHKRHSVFLFGTKELNLVLWGFSQHAPLRWVFWIFRYEIWNYCKVS